MAKNILAPLGITAAVSANDAEFKRKFMLRDNNWLISDEEMNDIMKIVQVLEDSNISLKEVTKTIKNKTKGQKGGFLGMLLGTLGTRLLGNMLAG